MMASVFSLLLSGAGAAADLRGGVTPVPLVRLLALPDRYRGKGISTSGVARERGNGIWALYLDCESARMQVAGNSVAFHPKRGETAADSLEMKYVLVSGSFGGATARLGSYSGVFDGDSEAHPYPLLRELDDAGKPVPVDAEACSR